MDYIKIDLQGI